jgi:Uma2 family endonuclease
MTQATATIDLSSPAMKAWAKLPEGVLAEVINDKLEILASPSPYHGNISLDIAYVLKTHIMKHGSGKVFHAPVDVHLRKGVVVIPDIVFVAEDNQLVIADNGLHGSPDLHIEILSPRNKKRDLITKKKLYEEAGVKEYWIVDQFTKESYGYLLQDNAYGKPLIMNSKIHIRVLDTEVAF